MNIYIIWGIFAVVVAIFANSKGRDIGRWFILSIILSPIISFILLLILPNVSEQTDLEDGTLKACPFCAEPIKPAAIVCKHCGKDLAPSS